MFVFTIIFLFYNMETYEDIYKTICRVCLLRGDQDNMVPLTNNSSKDGLSSYGKAVKTFAQITIEKDQYLPETMCAKCLLLLKQTIYFKFTCESSDKKLRNMLKFVSADSQLFKERIVEFIMYGQIFPKEIYDRPEKHSISVKKVKKCTRKEEKKMEKNENVVFEIDSDHFDISSSYEPQITKNPEINDQQLLEKLESLVESNALYSLDSDFKRVKRKKKSPLVKSTIINNQKHFKKTEKFVCVICEKVMANRNTYDCHMQRHNGFRYICEHCGKGFPIMHELQVHQVCKHGTGPYLQCQHCPFKAPRKFDLIEHERLHTGERPFACDKCGLTFRRRGIWKKHLIHHSEKTVQCNQCPRKFYQRSEMLAHCNNIHERVYMYSCSKCCATYAKTSTVRRHMTEKHGIPREMQGKVLRINKGSATSEHLERINKVRIVNNYVESITKETGVDEYINKNKTSIVNKYVEKDPIFSI